MGPRNPSPDPLSESESEEEESANYLNESSGQEWDSSEEEDPVVPNLTPLESLAWQVKCLLKYSTTWKPLNPNSWLYHAKLLDPSTPVHILREIGLRLSHCSHCVPKLEPIPEWPPLASCGVPPFQRPLTNASRLSRDHATLNGALQFATKQLSRTLSRATPIPEYLKQIPNSCVSGCCCGWLTKTVKETTRTEPINTTYSYTDFQKAVNKLLTASL
ncbi:DDB1- and CUL4-associated factor 16 [Mirounga angustirostris]|uniref:DDB1- and CUL4-associated factor 16 n=1 Tax=Mirounga leonina TaxID=9715 RepID=UPI00156C47C5|nr:DDB1- and CUL4-associated factor 16 [Mirounga leonina]XP_045737380.1 DDB1- and CUL4-associated factor 16 [Mirounga angustirostris]